MTRALTFTIACVWLLPSLGMVTLAVLGVVFNKEGAGLVASWTVALVAPLWAVLFTSWPELRGPPRELRPYLFFPLVLLTVFFFGMAYAHFVGHALGDRTIGSIIDDTKDIMFLFQGGLITCLLLYLGKH